METLFGGSAPWAGWFDATGIPGAPPRAAPTPRTTVLRDGRAAVYRFAPADPTAVPAPAALPLLLVPSLVNRWYVLDLHARGSVAGALVAAGVDTFCLDWGAAGDEDRFQTWDDLVARLARAVRAVQRITGAPRVALLGYSSGGTMATVFAAREPARVAALVNLAGPVDFAHAGLLGALTDPRYLDADAVADAGNVHPTQLFAGFVALRPTGRLGVLAHMFSPAVSAPQRAALAAMESWAMDTVPFPAEAWRTLVRDLYQRNSLVRGEHSVLGAPVRLRAITCPVLTIVAERDNVCPPAAATALNDHCGSADASVLRVPGGHVSGVVGESSPAALYSPLARWLRERLAR